jgi:hypothetical protein
MKTTTPKRAPVRTDRRSAQILRSARDARKAAAKSARMHGVPLIYLKNGKLVRERL